MLNRSNFTKITFLFITIKPDYSSYLDFVINSIFFLLSTRTYLYLVRFNVLFNTIRFFFYYLQVSKQRTTKPEKYLYKNKIRRFKIFGFEKLRVAQIIFELIPFYNRVVELFKNISVSIFLNFLYISLLRNALLMYNKP